MNWDMKTWTEDELQKAVCDRTSSMAINIGKGAEEELERRKMKQGEAAEKIMEAADHYASQEAYIEAAHDRGTTEDYKEAQRMAKESRQELEQTVKLIVGSRE